MLRALASLGLHDGHKLICSDVSHVLAPLGLRQFAFICLGRQLLDLVAERLIPAVRGNLAGNIRRYQTKDRVDRSIERDGFWVSDHSSGNPFRN